MKIQKLRPIYISNSLPQALHHYEEALTGTLEDLGLTWEHLETPSIEVGQNAVSRIAMAVRTVFAYASTLRRSRGTVIALWPGLGFLECLAWLPASMKHRVIVIIHDPIPIRRQFGYSAGARSIGRFASLNPRLTLLTHTRLAHHDLSSALGRDSVVVPHPVGRIREVPSSVGAPPTVRVLGQFKPSRDLQPLVEIGRALTSTAQLEICGRGWPEVDGWKVDPGFLSESDFDDRLRTSDCVVIPYARFYQSGVAVRCLELGVPIVGPAHEHLVELYGADWPGLVGPDGDWVAATKAVLTSDTSEVARKAHETRRILNAQWGQVLGL
ncbi:hypothetical protein [Nocardioides terrigena]|uniref:hypothetical protein n=1 Tax=Nocardioides terrigena TaxID=424797 RepID=UPI00131F15D8|nr:hypothetical protein [Nocardioides terrigena]